MTLSSISSLLSSSQLESVTNKKSTSSTQGTSGLATDGPPGLSQMASLMKQLEDLQQSDPAKFKEVAAEIAQKLKDAAQAATESGDTQKAQALTDLADKFTTASEDGTMPDLRPPDGANGVPPMGPPPGPPPGSDSDDSSSTDDTTSTDATSSASAASLAKYKEMLALFAKSSESNPMATLEGILSDALSTQAA